MKGWTDRLGRSAGLRSGETPLFVVLLLPQLEAVSQDWRLLDKPVELLESDCTGRKWPFMCNPFIGWGRHAWNMYRTLTVSHLTHGTDHTPMSIQQAVKYFILPIQGCLLLTVLTPDATCEALQDYCIFCHFSSFRKDNSWGLRTPQLWDIKIERMGGKRKDFFFSFIALIASAGQKKMKQPFCSFQGSQLLNLQA